MDFFYNLHIIILCNIILNWFFLDPHRLIMFRNVDLVKRTLQIYIGIIVIEEMIYNIEYFLLDYLFPSDKIFLACSVIHATMYYMSNSLYMSTSYSVISALILFCFFWTKSEFNFIHGLLLHVYYKSFNFLIIHIISKYSK